MIDRNSILFPLFGTGCLVTILLIMLLDEVASTADCIVFHVADGVEQLPGLAVHVRLVAGNLDHAEDAAGLVEDTVHLLQRTVGGLGEEEVDNGDDGGIAKRGQC